MLLSVQKITKHFPVEKGLLGQPTSFVKALDEVSLEVGEGQIVGVVGESGCGKSTLGRCVVGLHTRTSGQVLWKGEDPSRMGLSQRRETQRFFSDGLPEPLCFP